MTVALPPELAEVSIKLLFSDVCLGHLYLQPDEKSKLVLGNYQFIIRYEKIVDLSITSILSRHLLVV